MKFEAYITITDEHGRVESHKKANSLVLAMIDILYIQMSQVSGYQIKDTGNTSQSCNTSSNQFKANAIAGDANLGIIVGAGTNAVAISNNALQTKIAHGSGATQLSYGATSVGIPQTSGSSRQFTISRTFTGNPTSSVTVNEIGIYVNASGTTFIFCIDRTLNTFIVGGGASKTVTYTIKVTV